MQELCEHKRWNIDSNNIGTCANPECKEIRLFPFEKGEEVRILRQSKCNTPGQALSKEEFNQVIENLRSSGRDTTELEKIRDEVYSEKSVESKKKKKKRKGKGSKFHQQLPNFVKHRYYEENKDAIVADLFSLGRPATRAKWNIPSSTMSQLQGCWLTAEQRAQITAITYSLPAKPRSPKTKAQNGRLPAFPEFSNNWDPAIQLKWLEIYEGLIEIKPVKEVGSV
jgi:hypothetical protein